MHFDQFIIELAGWILQNLGAGAEILRRVMVTPSSLATAPSALLDRAPLGEWDLVFVVGIGGGLWWAHPVLDFGSHGHEGLFHVRRVLSRRLQEWDPEGIGKFLKKEKLEL